MDMVGPIDYPCPIDVKIGKHIYYIDPIGIKHGVTTLGLKA